MHETSGAFFVPHDIAAPVAGSGDGPLAGLEAAVKDMYDIAGFPTGAGNPTWLATHAPPKTNAAAVAKILRAGATIIGKTICDELFFSVTGINAHYGAPANLRAPGADSRRLVERIGRRHGGGRLRLCDRQRHRRLGPRPGRAVRHLRPAADP